MDIIIERYFKNLSDKKIAFIGIGRSNLPAIELFAKYGADITVCDRRMEDKFPREIETLSSLGVKLKLGETYLDNIDADIVFRTPGLSYLNPELIKLRENGIAVSSEMEVFFELCPCKIIAVTGSDGKTTTTTIIAKMLEKQGKRVFLGGNIGKPLLPQIFDMKDSDIAVVELSSFQLMSMRKSPDIAVITNLAPNHLDVHKDMDEYINAKKNIIFHQGAESRTVLNLDNKLTESFANEVRGEKFFFSREKKPYFGTFVKNNSLYMSFKNKEVELFSKSDIAIPGEHNVENYLAACSALCGIVSKENMKEVAKTFTGVEHRMEFVREINGVKYYNDAIATSPSRCMCGALSLYDEKIIMIAGGYDKNLSFEDFAETVSKKVKLLILMGNTSEKIEKAVRGAASYTENAIKIKRVNNMQEAVELANSYAEAGDKVYMSPACASFDMYKDFEAKGNDFKDIVNSL